MFFRFSANRKFIFCANMMTQFERLVILNLIVLIEHCILAKGDVYDVGKVTVDCFIKFKLS